MFIINIKMCMYHNGCLIFLIVLGIIMILIGFPTYMCGCNNLIGPCVKYTKHIAIVSGNECYQTKGNDNNNYNNNHDDTIGDNYNVHVQYLNHDRNITCPIYRSDSDSCNGLITHMSIVNDCNNLNKRDYPLHSKTYIYVDHVDGKCASHFYVNKLAVIGFIFLILGIALSCFGYLKLKLQNRTNTALSYQNIIYNVV
jgi:uncharacterized membrane protein